MPRLGRRVGPIGVAFALYDTWRRLPPEHRRRLVGVARRHGPRVAGAIVRRRLRVKPKI